MRHVILGNGVCGLEAALALRQLQPEAAITLVGDEHDHLYSRPALMYVFAGQLRLQDTEPYDRGLYARLGFERVRGRVLSVDTSARRLALEGGASLAYDQMLLAVGSRPRPAPWPGSDGASVHTFVTLRDLEGLDRQARRGMRAVVVGGGLIGVEVAEILRDRGLHVTWLVRDRWYFPVALDAREAAMVAEHVGQHGCDVRLGVEVEEIVRAPDGSVRAVRAAREEIPCDLVVSGIGVVPNTAFLAGSGIALAESGAVEVDERLRTSCAGVWAAGDCANVTWADGTRRPEQLWYTARDQGRVAGAALAGQDATYRRGTWYNSAKFFDLEYTTAGWVPASVDADGQAATPGPDIHDWFQRSPGDFDTQRIVCRGDRVVGFNMVGRRWNHELFLEWIHDRRDLSYVLARLHEAQFDEEFSRPFRVQAAAGVR
jgi:NADPH-dependent 2,4-dienoyl-CoA reductase/sulfur reductase-like enzyme